MRSKKRQAFGERHGRVKLTEADVIAIRRQRASDGLTYVALGKQYGVSLEMIYRIIKGKAWKHLPLHP
jgi:Mor family transcriptional regulator